MKEKIFIVFDGIDGDGKTTQVSLLKEYLEKKGVVFITSEPTESEYGKKINNIIRQRLASRTKKETWIELFTKDSEEHQKIIQQNLDDKKIVICDRYIYSTLAYQFEEKEWQDYSSKFIKPDIIFILDLSADTALKRVKEKYEKTKEKKAYFEKIEVLRKVRKQFLALPRFLNHNIKIINSDRKIDEIFKDIKKEIDLII